MVRFIPTSVTESNYEEIVSLDGEDYLVKMLWNSRDRHWYLTVRDSDDVDICTGFKVVSDFELDKHETDERHWPGQIWTVDLAQTGVDPGLRDLGSRVRLLYIDAEDLP
jgi:hypothetical protein